MRLAALLAGQPLVELALSAGTDTADLLGGFEQLEPLRRVQVPTLQVTSGRMLAGKVIAADQLAFQCKCLKWVPHIRGSSNLFAEAPR